MSTRRTMARLAIALGAALIAAPASAADAQVAGAWSITGQLQLGDQLAVAQPVCSFQQQGAALTGGCEGPGATGPVSGTVAGQHVTFQWRHTPRVEGGLKGVSTFDGQLAADGAIS